MNKMKFPNLSFNKICITYHNDKKYFLHYQNLIQCIKNILAVPDITQNFVLSFENYEREGESVYKEQNNGMWWKNTEGSLPTGAKLLPIILLEDGIDLSVNNEIIWFYPRVSTIISDWPEAASFCLVYKFPNSTFPCHFCLVKKDDLANINLPFNDVVPRTHNEMRRYLENNTPNSASIESVPNFFWNLP